MDDPANQLIPPPVPGQPQEQEIKVSDWKKKFAASEKAMKRDFLPKYKLASDRIRAEHAVKGRGTNKLTHEQVNMGLSIGTSFVNSVYFKSPSISLQGTSQNDLVKVSDTETACNDWLAQSPAKKVFRRSIWDAFKGGIGAVFIDYEYDDVENDQQIGVIPAQDGSIDPMTGQPALIPQMGRTVLKNEITIQRIRPDLLRFPKGFDFDNYQNSPWLGFDMIIPIEDVKSNEKWDEVVRDGIKGESYDKLSNENKIGKTNSVDSEDLYAKISYCFVKGANKLEPMNMIVFCSSFDEKPLEYIPFDKGHKGYPIHPFYFNPLDDDVSYPNGDLWNIESQLNAIDEWWQQFFNHVKRSKPKFVYDAGSVTPQELMKLKSNDDNGWVGLKNPQKGDLRALFADLKAAELNKDLTELYNISRQIMSEIAPKSNQSRGDGKETDTATQAKIIEAADGLDVEARIDDVSDLVKAVTYDVCGILDKSLAAPISVTSEEDDQGNPQASREMNPGSFTSNVLVTVDRDSLQSNNRDLIRRHLMESLKIFTDFKPYFDQAGIMPDPKFWAEQLMETMAVRNIDKGFIPAPPPQPIPPPPDKVSESMSFKDLPVEGQIQMAAKVGIHLSPEALIQQQVLLAQSKQPQNPNVSHGTNSTKRTAPHQGGGNIPSGAAPMGQQDMQMAGQA